jgi:hypothetical protein
MPLQAISVAYFINPSQPVIPALQHLKLYCFVDFIMHIYESSGIPHIQCIDFLVGKDGVM